MSCTVVVGAQWGDEGKGKIVDLLSEQSDVIVRFQGGNNAGHTIIVGDQSYVLHLIPSGVLHGKCSILGNGMVIDPAALAQEVEMLSGMNVGVNHIKISNRAHVVMPYHKIFDGLNEQKQGENKIGTTKRGIGPCYMDKVGRSGIRFGDLADPERLRKILCDILPEKNCLLKYHYKSDQVFEVDAICEEYHHYYRQFEDSICDGTQFLDERIKAGARILFEGAQGSFLDIDHGTYPFVTSSNTVAGAVCSGAGIGPSHDFRVIGIMKAYTTRVGSGPFPTEQENEVGTFLRSEGHEFGATTGRPRRCGWFDSVLARQAVCLNGITDLAITKLDVLDKLEFIQVATAYQLPDGTITKEFPMLTEEVTPVYETLPGWQSSTRGITSYELLPENAKVYLSKLREWVGAPISIISTGPERNETLFVE